MSRDRTIHTLLALLGGLFLGDLFLFPGGALPAVAYGVPILLASWLLPPLSVVTVAAAACILQIASGALQGDAADVIAFKFAAVALVGILTVALSARIQREEALRRQASEEREQFRFLTENTRDIIFRLDLVPNTRCKYVSPAIRDVLGYTPEEMYEDPAFIERFVHPEDLPGFRRLATNPTAERTVTFRALHRDGHVVWLEQRNTAILDEEGSVVGYEGVARDVTERKMAEEEVQQASAELEAVFKALPDMLLRLDSEDRVVDY